MIFLIISIFIVIILLFEKTLHERRLHRVSIRVHVNGTRGKSSVTRLIAAALRHSGIRTLAKVTGERPTLIHPDGREEILPRRGPTRIQEQLRFIKKASYLSVDAVVVECMAVDPHLQFISETRMIKSTVGVITNVRPDHLEVMGHNLNEIAESLSNTIPQNGMLITGDQTYYDFFKAKAKKKNSTAYLAGTLELQAKNGGKISILESNLAVAKLVCTGLGLDPERVTEALRQATSSSMKSAPIKARIKDRTIYFLDGFSANDIESARIIQDAWLNGGVYPKPFVALLNNRSDRPLRMLSFVGFLAGHDIYDHIVLLGGLRRPASRLLRRWGKGASVIVIKTEDPEQVLNELFQRMAFKECTLVGLGNLRGIGETLSQYLRTQGGM
ncbi:MAG: poly-gamma-glutamate synthase PgsB [Desulfobacterales bacterium]|nr:MAG: poly-gamma-glutamate synthase PgsB [Desulfobacterales bacterium]